MPRLLKVPKLFTCAGCGAHDLVVTHEYTVTVRYTDTLPCTCGGSREWVAGWHVHRIVTAYRESGLLDGDHCWEYEDQEPAGDSAEEDGASEVLCSACVERAAEDEWATTAIEPTVDRDSQAFYVNCDGCNREIEFGWSHPGQGGRIWPTECTDFIPWACWPEPRYREAWVQRNWLGPTMLIEAQAPPHTNGAMLSQEHAKSSKGRSRGDSNLSERAADLFSPRPVALASFVQIAPRPAAREQQSRPAGPPDELLRALAGEGLSLRQIAQRAGVSHETIRRRLQAAGIGLT